MLIKTIDRPTEYCLPVKIKTKKGYIYKNKYYDSEKTLFKAFYQLKMINGVVVPLFPVVFSNTIKM